MLDFLLNNFKKDKQNNLHDELYQSSNQSMQLFSESNFLNIQHIRKQIH